MDFGKLPLFSLMSQRLAWLGKRQQVLAQNIANVDTPGFRAKDVNEPGFKEMIQGAGPSKPAMVVTHATHLGGAHRPASVFKTVVDKEAEVSLSGNSVSIEDQVLKVNRTAMDHQVTVNLYRKHIAMIKAALGRPGS
ncbi:MAG: flagellar basal body rod protein FlgB [Alphaproteobacteria bacterium]|nr:flagellar basal body rod protein FlgB [Alphaproteobacteria bacterium]